MGFARTGSRPCVYPLAVLASGSLLFACPKRSNQEKGTLTAAVAGRQPGAYARTLRRFADGTSVCRQRTRAHRARAPLGFSLRDLAAAERDPVGARARPSWPQKPRQSNALCFALDSGSLCGAAKGGRTGPRAPHAGEREGPRSFRCRAGCPVSETPAALSAPALRAGATPRVCSLWLLSLAQVRESNSSARKADETTHGRESALAKDAEKTKEQNQKS